jgi:hypothetical protein
VRGSQFSSDDELKMLFDSALRSKTKTSVCQESLLSQRSGGYASISIEIILGNVKTCLSCLKHFMDRPIIYGVAETPDGF